MQPSLQESLVLSGVTSRLGTDGNAENTGNADERCLEQNFRHETYFKIFI
jgi:hypothetical protein